MAHDENEMRKDMFSLERKKLFFVLGARGFLRIYNMMIDSSISRAHKGVLYYAFLSIGIPRLLGPFCIKYIILNHLIHLHGDLSLEGTKIYVIYIHYYR